MAKKWNIETLAVHAGAEVDEATGAVTPPIHMSTTFERAKDGSYAHGYVYTRSNNPTRERLERALATLEGGEEAICFASGSAAAATIFHALHMGHHIIAPDDMYHGVRKMLNTTFAPWGLQMSFVDMTHPKNVVDALQPNTRLIWVETPSNPLLKITDIKLLAKIAHGHGAFLVVDATWTPATVQRPLALGADLVVHSSTKYLSGHSDVLGGAVIARKKGRFVERIRHIQEAEGAVPSPFDCWLTLRGLRTLPYRMRAHCENAGKVAAFLDAHPYVALVHYPGLDMHPGHRVAQAQMQQFGGMLSFEIIGGAPAAMKLCANLELFTRATSLGGIESLIEHRASTEGPESTAPQGLLRVSVGLEHPDDLIADLKQAFYKIRA